MDQAWASWALEAESSSPSFPEPEGSLLDSCRTLETDITREKDVLTSVQELLSKLTSLQTKKRLALQKKADLEKIYSHPLEVLGSLVTDQHVSSPGSWSDASSHFTASDHYRSKYVYLLEKQTRLQRSRGEGGFFHSLGQKASSLFTSLRLSRAEAKQKSSLTRLSLSLLTSRDFRPRLEALAAGAPEPVQTAVADLTPVISQIQDLEDSEQEVRASLESFGASSSPTRRLAEIQRTLQALQSRLGDQRIKRGRSLHLEAQKCEEALSPWEARHYSALTHLETEYRSIQEDLVKYQAAAEIKALEDRNALLAGKVRLLEEQIDHHNQEITANQRLIQEKRKISGDILP